LSASGIFNLTDGSYSEWGNFSAALGDSIKALGVKGGIFDSRIPPLNSAIGAVIQ